MSRPFRAVAGGWFALDFCRVVSIRTDVLAGARRRCYSTSGTAGRVARSRDEGACSGRIETTLGGSAWSRVALDCCRVVSIRTDVLAGARRRCYSTSGRCRWSSSAEPRRRSVFRAYRDHSEPSLRAGSRWTVAGWSRYAPTCSLALAVLTTRPAMCSAGRVARNRDEGACSGRIETTLGGSAWSRVALGRGRVVSIRQHVLAGARRPDYSTSDVFRWSSSAEP